MFEFRRDNREAFEAAFKVVLLMARDLGLLTLGTVSIDGTDKHDLTTTASEPHE
jgi:hypothetical protein